jgi:CheY-like chemotaxis protein
LLVEDNPTDVFVIKGVLAQFGFDFRLHILDDGHDALIYLRELELDKCSRCPALILLDLNLPRVSGLDVLRKLRGESRCRYTPVIIVSSSTDEADRLRSQELGVAAYFQKPNDLAAYAELGTIVKGVLRAR